MVRSATALILAALTVLVWSSRNQACGQPGADPVSIQFVNRTSKPLIVQGVSIVGGMLRKGPAITVPPGKVGWDNDVPPGPRQYRVYDGTQPSRVLNPSVTVQVKSHDLSYLLIPNKTGSGVEMVPVLP